MSGLCVTTSSSRDQSVVARARATASRLGLPFFERPRNTGLVDALGGERLSLVLGGQGWTLREGEVALPFTPGMAYLRIKRFLTGIGGDDRLVQAGGLKAGDAVLDATLGLGNDALVAAFSVGPTGRVVALEASQPLWALFAAGFADYEAPWPLAPVEALHGDSFEYLKGQPDGSVDCVFFDPMFDRPTKSSPPLAMLRQYSKPDPIGPELLREAQRVARRWVVVKAARYGRQLKALGLQALPFARSGPVVWGRAPGRGG